MRITRRQLRRVILEEQYRLNEKADWVKIGIDIVTQLMQSEQGREAIAGTLKGGKELAQRAAVAVTPSEAPDPSVDPEGAAAAVEDSGPGIMSTISRVFPALAGAVSGGTGWAADLIGNMDDETAQELTATATSAAGAIGSGGTPPPLPGPDDPIRQGRPASAPRRQRRASGRVTVPPPLPESLRRRRTRITKRQLRRIIREEYSRANLLKEGWWKDITSALPSYEDMRVRMKTWSMGPDDKAALKNAIEAAIKNEKNDARARLDARLKDIMTAAAAEHEGE